MQPQHTSTLLLVAHLATTWGLIGYDCGGQGLNITSISLLNVGECEVEDLNPKSEDTYLQLLQLSEYDNTQVIQCKIEIDRTIFYCGMHSHISAVQNGRKEYIMETNYNVCRRLHDSGGLTLGNSVYLTGLKVNQTSSRGITLAGWIGNDGKCSGTQYSDPFGTWSSVVVQASVKVTLRTFQGATKYATNTLVLPSGKRCQAGDGECLDMDGSETYWTVASPDSCNFGRYDVLYEGTAIKLTPKEDQRSPIIYTVTTKETTFALAKTTETNLCGYKLVQTEHPKLFILETQKGRTFKARSQISVDNLDIFSYVNSKFIYVEKHLKTQLTQLYRDIMEQKCALERQILKNALSLSSLSPDEMAYRIMREPGYTAVAAGEVLHVIKCVATECRIRQTELCYNELPVTHNNQSYFLAPRSHILIKTGTVRECSELLPTMYHVEGSWFRLMPRPVEAIPPPTIQPLTRPKWHYVSPKNLATSGIYSNEDLDRLKNHIMFPVEKPNMLNTIARGAMGHQIPPGSVSMMNLFDEDTLEKFADSTAERLWNGFMTFGSASAGVLAIILIIRLAKTIIDSIIRGYALHSVYGWSLHLVGAIWSSITHLLLQLAGRKNPQPTTTAEEDSTTELMPRPLSPEEAKRGKDEETAINHRTRDYGELNKYLSSVP